jgi:hypothetical protein
MNGLVSCRGAGQARRGTVSSDDAQIHSRSDFLDPRAPSESRDRFLDGRFDRHDAKFGSGHSACGE